MMMRKSYTAKKKTAKINVKKNFPVYNNVYSLPFNTKPQILFIKKLQAIYLMLYKRWYQTAKIQKYKHEHYALA